MLDWNAICVKFNNISLAEIFIALGGIWAWYKFHKQNKFNWILQEQKNELDKSLKNHEQQLNQIIEDQKYLNQRRLTDFSLYAKKKHEKVIDLYEKLSIAQNQVLFQDSPLRQVPTFTDYNEKDMIEFLDKFKLTRAAKNELLEGWKVNRKNGVEPIYKMMTSQENIDTSRNINELIKSEIEAQLYLSCDISEKLKVYRHKLQGIATLCNLDNRENINGDNKQKMYEKRTELVKSINIEFPIIVEELKQWLLNASEKY